MDDIASKLAALDPRGRRSHRAPADEDDAGEEIDFDTVAAGAHLAKSSLRVSHALRSLLVSKGVCAPRADGAKPHHHLHFHRAGNDDDDNDIDDAALRDLLAKPHVRVPPELTSRSHPLPEYFISSSHNTYLTGHQLHGSSSAAAYTAALGTGSRCVEIDAWDHDDNPDEPKVTHGYTLVSHIPFRAVCEAIRDVVDREAQDHSPAGGHAPAPIFLSLENHCAAHGQRRLATIMREVFGERLLSAAVRAKGTVEQEHGADDNEGAHVTLGELGSKIAVMVEFHLPDEESDTSSSSSSSEDEDARQAHEEYRKRRRAAAPSSSAIVPELAELGVYAQSVKPRDNSWFEEVREEGQEGGGGLRNGPHHHLINVSETGLAAHLPAARGAIARHNAAHLMRVFPKGTRISSKNLRPVPFWAVGAQVCALNWQTFGAGMQLNTALFAGTDGYVLKPAALRRGGSGELQPAAGSSSSRTTRLHLTVAGATDVPIPEGSGLEPGEIRPYATCSLVHPDGDDASGGGGPKRKTRAYRQHKLGFLHRGENPPPTEPVWDEVLEWEYATSELAFLRLLVKSDESFAANPTLAVAAIRLLYAVPGWSFVPMLDLKGRETGCSLLVKVEMTEA